MKYMGNKQKIADEILTVIFNDSKKILKEAQFIVTYLIKVQNNMKLVRILIMRSFMNGVEKIKVNIKYSFPNIICQKILNVFGKKKLQIQ